MTLQKLTEEFQRGKLTEILALCTASQQELFRKIYPKGVSNTDLCNAYDLCERTLKKNQNDPTRTSQNVS